MTSQAELERAVAIGLNSVGQHFIACSTQLAALHAGIPILVREDRGSRSFWRVPIEHVSGDSRKCVGHFDLRTTDAMKNDLGVVRYSIKSNRLEDAILSKTKDTTEMTRKDICAAIIKTVGDTATVIGNPNCVYIGFESKVAWKCRVTSLTGESWIFVTTGATWPQAVDEAECDSD